MTDTGSPSKPPTDELAGSTVAEASAPAPEPMTPARVFEWNSYYDLYVAIFVVLLAFLCAANKLQAQNSGVFSLLQAGRQTIEQGSPVLSDTSSIAGEDRRWVNLPWLFEVVHYGLYSAGASLILPAEAKIPEGTTPEAEAMMKRVAAEARATAEPKAEQVGIGALIAMDSLIRAMAALLLLGLRRKGPGLWWTALCVTLALGVTLGPMPVPTVVPGANGEMEMVYRPWFGMQIGGITTVGSVVSPETWGVLLLAVELLLLHQATNLGKKSRLYALVPLFLLWANVGDSFASGLLVLGASVIGLFVDFKKDPASPPPRSGLIALGLCFAACFLNPSHVHGVLAGFGTILRVFYLNVGPPSASPLFLFGSSFSNKVNADAFTRSYRFYYVILVAIGLASFLLNRRKLVLGRLLTFVVVAAFWMLAFNDFTWVFALVLASTLALNGQEWYHRVYGVEGKMGLGWSIWSTGGRVVTIAVIFVATTMSVTGWGSQMGDPQFGFGFNPDEFPFEVAGKLKNAPIEGNILNTTMPQGDAIAWKTLPKHKAFIDNRQHLYPPSVFEEWRQLRLDLKTDEIAKWQPVLDRYKISAVMLQLNDQPDSAWLTYYKLMRSPNWVPFYDDGAVVMFGRADSKALPGDVAYFQANRLDAENLVYKKPQLVPSWERPPTKTDMLDRVFQNRLLNRPQPHNNASLRWMNPADAPQDKPVLLTPANALMSIREARIALSIKPDDTSAFQRLIDAYNLLLTEESALILGVKLDSENMNRIGQSPRQYRLLANRTRQLLTAFNFRISTLPPPKSDEDLLLLTGLNLELVRLYLQVGAYDLAKERIELVLDDARKTKLRMEVLSELSKQLGDINQQLDKLQAELTQRTKTYNWGPLDQASFARANGAPGLAITTLEAANETGARLPGVLPALVDLCCDVGQPDRAFDAIVDLESGSDKLSTLGPFGVGTASYRQGLVFLLLGSYDKTFVLWNSGAINQILWERSIEGPKAGQFLLGGDPVQSTKMFMELPEKASTQAQWEFELALAAQEGGFPPEIVAEHFENALKLEPNMTVRPLIAYYLQKYGKPVPPPRVSDTNYVELPPEVETPKPTELPANPFLPEPAKPTDPPKP